jgi:hypothetical protein
MKNLKTLKATRRVAGFTALIAVIIFTLGSCIINVPDDNGGSTPNTSIEGIWEVGDYRIEISGRTGTLTRCPRIDYGNALVSSAIDKGYIKVGTQWLRYISKDNNRERTWTGQRVMFHHNIGSDVCTGTSYSDTGTFTLDSNGKSLVFLSNASDGYFTETYTRY